MKRAKVLSLSLILLFFVLSTVASAAEMWPGWWKGNNNGGTGGTGGTTGGNGYSVAEPTAILLLGAGLVSLAVYAKKKRGKK